MPNYAVYHNANRLITQVQSFQIVAPEGHTTRLLSGPEFTIVDDANRSRLRTVVDVGNVVRLATSAETDNGFTPEQYMLKRIPEMALANRPAAYDVSQPVLFALKANDKEGAKAVVDASGLTAAAKTKLKELIDAS